MKNIEIGGNPKVVGSAPKEALEKQLSPLLDLTSASNVTLNLIRRLPPGDTAGVLIQRVAPSGGVQVSIHTDTPEKHNYRCLVATNSVNDNDFFKELRAAMKKVAKDSGVPQMRQKSYPRRAKKRDGIAVLDNLQAIIACIAKTTAGGPAGAKQITADLMKTFKLKGKASCTGIIYRELRGEGYLKVNDNEKPKTYELTDSGIRFADLVNSGTLINQAKIVGRVRSTRQAPSVVHPLSPLQQKIIELEQSENKVNALTAEISSMEEAISAKRIELQTLQASIGKLGEIKKLLEPNQEENVTT
ncbi:hypothetical protein KGQ27_03675 [Patescibacteria group bacterium]|nr:hypothetical protein [Patescibacteria group bacterium]MDE1946940.1 hypothetical protein [Patescibacteria group bacterium]MDE2011201.1 hypothetical protein [Patescibacteria group bacterium]MDE2233491.1 hypothetical protein [Patescibacteria group bacterium]